MVHLLALGSTSYCIRTVVIFHIAHIDAFNTHYILHVTYNEIDIFTTQVEGNSMLLF